MSKDNEPEIRRILSTNPENHYQVLDLERNVDDSIIKKKYRTLALLIHPDKSTPELRNDATEAFKLVNHSYEILHDPDTRAEYDRTYSNSNNRSFFDDQSQSSNYSSETEIPRRETVFTRRPANIPGDSSNLYRSMHTWLKTIREMLREGDDINEEMNIVVLGIIHLSADILLVIGQRSPATAAMLGFAIGLGAFSSSTIRNAQDWSPSVKALVVDALIFYYEIKSDMYRV